MYQEYFGFMLVVYACTLLYKWLSTRGGESRYESMQTVAFKRFQIKFFIVYFLAMASDWMQGPYVYRLYASYNFTRHENGILFIAGFGSSLLFGTWSGPFADKYGRKKACLMYCVIYMFGCATKHFNNFFILMLGRVFGGISTSLLWSVFESWMISEHHAHGFDPAWLGSTFSLMSTGNGLVAVASGLVAQWAADTFNHPVAPFDISAIILFFCFVIIFSQWNESNVNSKAGFFSQMRNALTTVWSDHRISLTGIQQSLFEGAMYAFIFLWTPALEETGPVPHGLVFASFMLSMSLGGALFNTVSVETVLRWMPLLYVAAAVTMLVVAFSTTALYKMTALVVFEVAVGLFWPSIAMLRAAYIPEECRASVMNVFRAPLNCFVCFLLLFQGKMPLYTSFLFCALLHLMTAVVAVMLSSSVKRFRG